MSDTSLTVACKEPWARYNVSMLSIATLAMIVPTASAVLDQWSTPEERLQLSRIVACLLLLMSAAVQGGFRGRACQ